MSTTNDQHSRNSRWFQNENPVYRTFPLGTSSVVTHLLLSRGRIICASDDHIIRVHALATAEPLYSLEGHEGGVWSLAITKDTLVSGSTDRTVRVWDLETRLCTHVFSGHTGTVRCLSILKPEWVDGENGVRERWPKRPLIVTGSRDTTVRVWNLPRPGEDEYQWRESDADEDDTAENDATHNPYYLHHLKGHGEAVRYLSTGGRTIVSGSYDTTVRVWDAVSGDCKWVLVGHTQKVYCVLYDGSRKQVYSSAMDGTVRIWDINTGECRHTLVGHTSLVGLLRLSPSFLVSAAADATSRIWNPNTGKLYPTLDSVNGAITCLYVDDYKIISGSDGVLKLWSAQTGYHVRDLLRDTVGFWEVAFKGRWCVAVSNINDSTILNIWDFETDEEDEDEEEDSNEGYQPGEFDDPL